MTPKARVTVGVFAALALGWVGGRWTAPSARSGSANEGQPSPSSNGSDPTTPTIPPSVASTAESPIESASSAAPGQAELVTRARAGELDALKTLDERTASARTIDESLALEAGHAALARADAATLAADLARDPKLLSDTSTMAYAYRLAFDASAAPALLGGIASIEDPGAPDFLYDLAKRGEPGSRLTLLAGDLLHGAAVRKRASRALAIALDLEQARACAVLLSLTPRIEADADDRALPMLARLSDTTGCGPKNQDDCLPCLRTNDAKAKLSRAHDAAKSRQFAPPWVVRAPGKRP